ncbi:hypothetical protein C1X35_13290 [Pseudomonas sp. FW306-1C-G01A]|nr:hypothetical protein [Pseudomonas mandelii]PMV87863.1 hypothetical protein C1X51_27095 [Pseudomonas sp. FW306-2-2C-B10A]PMV89892.1 hypothetical protein C1X56_02315 [Pseudomonas sp. GW101-1A09]PMW03042.1 hypothetical protein C1X55_00365 [Pseudomonas sp. GW460-C8]PMW07620.1 hypothetical protein C1X50_03325 [Pseudomonas sp. MPR-TSA4]PMW22513.1 hypothetical protein C1X52_01700 [Pseudomonas sp. FW306-2-1A-C05A]PMW24906.1 hypothetical protein C1X40_02990 [Pseudomonas sp. GW456-11-11-14-TSB2]PMW
MGDAGANTLPRQPASQGSKLHASAPAWVFCPNITLIKAQSVCRRKISPYNVALKSSNDLFWCAQNLLHINWLNLEQFPL